MHLEVAELGWQAPACHSELELASEGSSVASIWFCVAQKGLYTVGECVTRGFATLRALAMTGIFILTVMECTTISVLREKTRSLAC